MHIHNIYFVNDPGSGTIPGMSTIALVTLPSGTVSLWSLWAAWTGLLLGMISGAILGLGFHREHFWGGYGSWPRRLCRLGHISFFGLAIINFLFYATVRMEGLESGAVPVAGLGLLTGAVTMPLVCFLSAAWKPARHAFFVPVVSLLTGVVGTIWAMGVNT